MALFLFTRGIKAGRRGRTSNPARSPFPESVIDMLTGGLGWPEGGWPEAVSLAVLGRKRHAEARAKYEAALAAERKRARLPARRKDAGRTRGPRRTRGWRRTARSWRRSCVTIRPTTSSTRT